MFLRLFLFVFVLQSAISAAASEPSWKKPLAEKARIIEAGIVARHNILGLYPSMVKIPLHNGPLDITTATPFSDIAHAVCWTSNYLAGASYRYRFLKDHEAPAEVVAAARKRADALFEAVYRCQRVTGVRGLQARGYFLGHGPVYEERLNSSTRDEWHQGEVDGQAFRWRGHPSHHNYSDAIHGLGQYYDLAAEGPQKERAREAIDALVSYWVDNGLKIHKLDRSRRPVEILGATDGHTLNTRVMMAIAGAKVAFHATGKDKFKQTYDQLVKQYGVRNLKSFETGKDFDDAEHVFCHLDNLFRIEKEPELLRAYGLVADGLWKNHQGDGQSLFTYIYYHIRPDAAGRAEAMKQALRSLETWPTDMTIQPRMNSLFPDLKPPFPVYATAFDNEYIWKGNLLRPDGWLSRIVTHVAASTEDPEVLCAIDQNGDLYMSRDGATTAAGWMPIEGPNNLPVRSVDIGSRSRILAVTCHDGFYASTTGGQTWKRLPVPNAAGRPVDVFFDTQRPNVIFAVATGGVFQSRDYGEQFLGESWSTLTDDLPRGHVFEFLVALGKPTRLYARFENQMFTKTVGETGWHATTPTGLDDYSRPLGWLTVDPHQPNRLLSGCVTSGELGPVKTIIQQSTDAGSKWTNNLEFMYRQYAAGTLLQTLARLPSGKILDIVVDQEQPNTLYAIHEGRGVLKSEDGAATWKTVEKGLDIPLVKSLMAPRHTNWIFAGTPAGLFLSKDHGENWRTANLVLQFTKNHRRELGGAAFIDAYWRARYYGFIRE